jgi:hypothetical protein
MVPDYSFQTLKWLPNYFLGKSPGNKRMPFNFFSLFKMTYKICQYQDLFSRLTLKVRFTTES